MQTVQFHCPHCSNLMAVGLDLLGHQVHCPTCHKILVAPSEAPQAPAAEPEISFDDPKREEEHESIFGEVHDEDLFGSQRPKIVVPTDSPPIVVPASPSSHFADYPPPANDEDPLPAVAPEALPEPEPAAAPAVVMAPAHWPVAEAPAWQPADEHGEAPAPLEPRRREPTREQRKGANLLLAILGPYAVVMTLVAGYYFYKAKWGDRNDHPLANIPDAAALFDAPKRKELTRRLDFMPPVDAPLPASLKVRLGDTLVVGDLEVTPEKIERAPVRVHTVGMDDRTDTSQLPGEALILHLRVKNRSGDVSFCPTDPVFDRYHDRRRGGSKPYNQVVVGSERFYGGAVDILSVNWKQVKRKFVEGQDHDDKPLPPGEERRTVVCTDPQDNVLNALKSYAGRDPVMWRVQLRRGLTEFNGKEYPVCAVVGVQFSPSDVKSRQ